MCARACACGSVWQCVGESESVCVCVCVGLGLCGWQRWWWGACVGPFVRLPFDLSFGMLGFQGFGALGFQGWKVQFLCVYLLKICESTLHVQFDYDQYRGRNNWELNTFTVTVPHVTRITTPYALKPLFNHRGRYMPLLVLPKLHTLSRETLDPNNTLNRPNPPNGTS